MGDEMRDRVQKAFDAGAGPEAVPSDGGLGAPETLAKLRAPARRLAAGDLGGLLTKARQRAAEVARAIATATTEEERIDSRWTAEARQVAADDIRRRTVEAVEAFLQPLRELTGEAEAQRPLYSPAVLARSATFSSDPVAEGGMRQSWALRAAGADAEGLQALAILAATGAGGVNGVALGVVVADELRRRSDVGPGDRRTIRDLLPQPEAPAELATIDAVREAWQRSEWGLQELVRPGSTRPARLQRAFDKGRAAA
jgi:hypothetical protein